MQWTLHWLEAEGSLGAWRHAIENEILATREAIADVLTPPRLDVLIQYLPGMVIPEIGWVGHAYRHSLFSLQCDPGNENFEPSLSNGAVRRQVAHEVHHCLRMSGPGYGRTLGEAVVSEGLAGHFVRLLYDNSPEPWECGLGEDELKQHLPGREDLHATEYDHAAWFFGAGGRRPRWVGYSLGYVLVRHWLDNQPGIGIDTLINVDASTVLSALKEIS